jgi:hypothetical protein
MSSVDETVLLGRLVRLEKAALARRVSSRYTASRRHQRWRALSVLRHLKDERKQRQGMG